MWSSTARQISYGLPSEMGLRDLFVVTPTSASFHPNNHNEPINVSDPHAINGSNSAAALGVFPLFAGAPAGIGGAEEDFMNNNRARMIHLWQNQQSQQTAAYTQQSGGGVGGSAVTATCQDCGNQAKKDCSHSRCRSCCKSRGFDCSTHVKSTWVPAARRRERQLAASGSAPAPAPAAGSSTSTSGAKKPRTITSQTTTTSHTSTSNTTRSFDTSSSHQDASFKEALPREVNVPAVFKCVRVTAVKDGEDEYAYQAVVKISGHVFKGFLYDQGVEGRDHAFPNISQLHLGGGGSGSGGLLGGSSYGNQIN